MELMNIGERAIGVLERCGHEAYFVGGCVRDMLMGIEPHDLDITTSALPEETLKAFDGFRVIPTGLKHGTVTVLIENEPVEITTFRADGDYSDHRHPETVSFSRKLSDDLCRRDFTVNAMAYSKKAGVIDLYGGREDIKNGIIRAVGDPERRFTEDALRIMRAVRFASEKGFEVERKTAEAIKKTLHLMDYVSSERIFTELKKLIMGKGVTEVMLQFPDVICKAVPALTETVGFDQQNPHHIYDVYGHTAYAVGYCTSEVDVRLAALLHDCGKPQTFSVKDGVGHFYGHTDASLVLAKEALLKLKCDTLTMDTVLTLIKYHDPVIEPSEKAVKRALNKLGKDNLMKLLSLKAADNLAQAPECAERLKVYGEIRDTVSEIEAKNECFSLKSLAVDGDDIIALGIPRGKEIGKALSVLLNAVIEGELINEKEILLGKIKQIYGLN